MVSHARLQASRKVSVVEVCLLISALIRSMSGICTFLQSGVISHVWSISTLSRGLQAKSGYYAEARLETQGYRRIFRDRGDPTTREIRSEIVSHHMISVSLVVVL